MWLQTSFQVLMMAVTICFNLMFILVLFVPFPLIKGTASNDILKDRIGIGVQSYPYQLSGLHQQQPYQQNSAIMNNKQYIRPINVQNNKKIVSSQFIRGYTNKRQSHKPFLRSTKYPPKSISPGLKVSKRRKQNPIYERDYFLRKSNFRKHRINNKAFSKPDSVSASTNIVTKSSSFAKHEPNSNNDREKDERESKFHPSRTNFDEDLILQHELEMKIQQERDKKEQFQRLLLQLENNRFKELENERKENDAFRYASTFHNKKTHGVESKETLINSGQQQNAPVYGHTQERQNWTNRTHSKRESGALRNYHTSDRQISPKRLLSLLKKANNYLQARNPNVVCLPVTMCTILYGSKQEHYIKYGYVTPSQASCLSKNGLALCVEESESTTPKPTLPSNVVCRPIGACETLYGSDPMHFSLYGIITPSQLNCFSHNGVALCVENPTPSTSSPITTNPPKPNPFPHSDVVCRPIKHCQMLYGSDSNHFSLYGEITPSQLNCFSHEGNALCVMSPSNSGSNVPALPPSTIELPCVPITECRVIFGTMYQHSMYYGEQKACSRPHLKRCVAVEPYVPTAKPPVISTHHHGDHFYTMASKSPGQSEYKPIMAARPSTNGNYVESTTSPDLLTKPNKVTQNYQVLSCVLPTMCNEIFGTSYEHFIIYGHQLDCGSDSLVRCIEIGSKETTTSQPKERKDSRFQSVQIIGPKPIYLSFSQIEGPKVSNHFEGKSPHHSKEDNSGDMLSTVHNRYAQNNNERFKKNVEKDEKSNRLYLEGISLEKLFGSSNKAYNRRSDNVRMRFKKEAPSYSVIKQVTNTDENMLPMSAHKHNHPNRYQKDSTSPKEKRKSIAYKKDPEKSYKPSLNINSFEHLFFLDGGKIKLPYDSNKDSNNYLFFSPKRKLLKKE